MPMQRKKASPRVAHNLVDVRILLRSTNRINRALITMQANLTTAVMKMLAFSVRKLKLRNWETSLIG